MSYVRTYSSKDRHTAVAAEKYAWQFVLYGATTVILIIATLWEFSIQLIGIHDLSLILVGIGIAANLLCVMSQTRARLQGRYNSLATSTITAGIASICVSLAGAFWWRQDEVPLIMAVIVANLLPIAILRMPSITALFTHCGLTKSERLAILRIGIAGTVTAPAYWILTSSDRWFLGLFRDTATVGIYGIGCAVGSIGLLVNNAVMTVWTPETTREFERDPTEAPKRLGEIAERLIAGFACVWLAVTAAGGELVRLLAAPAFHEAAIVVPYISGGVFFYGIYHLSNATLLFAKKLKYSMWWWLAGGVVCLTGNIVLVPIYGLTGAAATQVASFSFIALGVAIGAQIYVPLRIRWLRLAVTLAISAIIGLAMVPCWAPAAIESLLYKFPAGIFASLLIIWLIDPKILRLRIGNRPSKSIGMSE